MPQLKRETEMETEKSTSLLRITSLKNNKTSFVIDPSNASEKRENNSLTKKISSIEDSVMNYNRFNSRSNFDNFVVGSGNQLAYTAAQKILFVVQGSPELFFAGRVKTYNESNGQLHVVISPPYSCPS